MTGTRGPSRRPGLAAAVCGVVVAATAAVAVAAPATISNSGNSFAAPIYNHEQGTKATYTNTGGGPHNAASAAPGPVGGHLFRSDDVSGMVSVPVEGTQSLPPGDYVFYCTFHGTPAGAGMAATLRVVGPTGAPPPGSTPTQVRRKNCKRIKNKKKRKRCLRRLRRQN